MHDRNHLPSDAGPPSGPRTPWWTVARWTALMVAVAVAGFAMGVYLKLSHQPETFTGERVVDRPGQVASFSWPFRLTDRVTILLIGTDITLNNRRQIVPISRADSLVVASFDPERSRVSALSIPRDTRARIPGVGTTKINAAYAFGGPGLTVKTVEDLLGIRIDYYVKLGPKSFGRLVDAIGGVEVDVEKDMKYTDTWAGLYINLKKGLQVLNGEQAEGYIRFRHDALGDIARVQRQQKVLLAIFRKLKQPSMVLRAPQLLRAFTDNTQTNLTPTELLTLGVFAARLEASDIVTKTLPGSIGNTYWEPAWDDIRQVVLDMFYGVSEEVLAATRVEVLNGTGVPGLGRRTAGKLQQLGFRIVRVGTADQTERTLIIDRTGRAEVTRLLASLLGQPRITQAFAVGDVDITILLARDYAASVVSRRP